MKTELFSISRIFTERLLRIPDYQRGYAWTDKQLKDFWGDLQQLERNHNHYFGVLTLEDVEKNKYSRWADDEWIIESKNYEPHYVVDGQQRLTTTVILIQCILEVIGESVINYTHPYEIRKKFIFESKDNGISRSYLFGYEVDNPSYEFLKQKIFKEHSDNQPLVQETIYTNNLYNSKLFFLDKLSSLSIPEIEVLYTKVTQNLLFNVYSMSDEVDVHVSFETMNNRGKPLSHLELLKNRLIYLSTKINEDEYERRTLRNSINECWKTIYHQLGRNKENPLDDDEFLFNHFILFYGRIAGDDEITYHHMHRYYRGKFHDYLLDDKFTTKSLNDETAGKLTKDELYKYVSSLKASVEKWYEISNPKDSAIDPEVADVLDKINKIGYAHCYPLIMVVFQKVSDTKMQARLVKSLERLLFCNMLLRICYVHVSSESFISWARELSSDELSLDKIISQMDEKRKELTSNELVQKKLSDSLKDGGFYRWDGIRYFMFEYEQELKTVAKVYTDKLKWVDDPRDFRTVEHIYPQNPRKACWTDKFQHYSPKERSILRHSLGNLLPLSHPKNSSFQNKPFLEKVGNESMVGYMHGSLSEMQVAKNSRWTAVEITKRTVLLLKFMERRWGIELGDANKLIKFSNLEFVLKKEGLRVNSKGDVVDK
ncbi:DUF262 domain-containing protein [Shewanella xiamenensis]|uniref:DUF262 domain-containing protein n=1 Tax=Shewanella xiamenensis TaxID=332186 RepID=A0AAW6QZ29_9GAMM|nr:DUF262 domain-containing HNH endonuclease family protein [Shewanella xiamenensis]MDG5901402.1 DUF262 domain-containing protein [Shewanella xiamenensis]